MKYLSKLIVLCQKHFFKKVYTNLQLRVMFWSLFYWLVIWVCVCPIAFISIEYLVYCKFPSVNCQPFEIQIEYRKLFKYFQQHAHTTLLMYVVPFFYTSIYFTLYYAAHNELLKYTTVYVSTRTTTARHNKICYIYVFQDFS